MAAENGSGFLIDDKLYEVPSVFMLTNDEAQILYDYTGLSIDDFLAGDDVPDEEKAELQRKFKSPALLRALQEIAYQRGNPDVRPAQVKALIGAATQLSVLSGLVADTEDEEDEQSLPPASTSEPAGSSPRSSLANEKSKKRSTAKPGNGSRNGSDEPDDQPTPTGRSK